MGILIVVPAEKILGTLYHPELVALRNIQDEQRSAAGANSEHPLRSHQPPGVSGDPNVSMLTAEDGRLTG